MPAKVAPKGGGEAAAAALEATPRQSNRTVTTNSDPPAGGAAGGGDGSKEAPRAPELKAKKAPEEATLKLQPRNTGGEDDENAGRIQKEISPVEKQALEDAFQSNMSTPKKTTPRKSPASAVAAAAAPPPRGLGIVHPDTPIPNSDVALRLLRKFALKTQSKISTTYGGTKSRSLLSFFVTPSRSEDDTFLPYRDLLLILFENQPGEDEDFEDDDDDEDYNTDNAVIVDSVLGESGDNMAKARTAVASFCYLFSLWGHVSSRYLEQHVYKSQVAFSELLSASYDAATQLVAHGCLDGVLIGMGGDAGSIEYHGVVNLLAQSLFNADLTLERNELAAMKFLLTTGCRTITTVSTLKDDGGVVHVSTQAAMLRGTHLLQTIRILYHIYLSTESSANKTTARAALQQLVTQVFGRVVRVESAERTPDGFPSPDHRDAFLVLRAICKLSMRNLPDPSTGMYAHVGLQASGSSETWEGGQQAKQQNGGGNGEAASPAALAARSGMDDGDAQRERAHLVSTAAIHPALESKLLALELLLYVLQNTEFTPQFIQKSGPQFHVAVRNYLCVSLLKNCTSDNTRVVNVSLRIFVPLMRNFRTLLKTEIEAFVTNVFFVILDSKNSPMEHKGIVVRTFDEICSNPQNLAEIFLNYDCDLSAVDLFHRIVNTLSKVSRTGLQGGEEATNTYAGSLSSIMGGASAARMERFRNQSRELRLDAMRALRQVLASLNASIVEPMNMTRPAAVDDAASLSTLTTVEHSTTEQQQVAVDNTSTVEPSPASPTTSGGSTKSLVEIYGSKKKRRAEESEVILRFNQKPSAGLAYASKCGHVDGEDPTDVARFVWNHRDDFDKTQIGEYLGREAEYHQGFCLKVLHEYVRLLDFHGLLFDEAIRYFLSGFRLPGEAQKIDRIMEKFAERFTEQNPEVFPSADVAFILAFSIIMLNTDLHNPAIKEERRMTKEGFIRNNRGICDGHDLPVELLTSIFDRIKTNPISLKEDDEARERAGETNKNATPSSILTVPAALSPAAFFTSHFEEMDRARETNFQKERDHIVRTTETLLKRRRQATHDPAPAKSSKNRSASKTKPVPKFVRTEDSGLRDEYVSPMFEVTWGPALAAFSTAMESANGTMGALIAIASDEELELAAENAAETIEVCLTGFKFAICTAGLCGNDVARDAYVLALSRFSQLGTGVLLEPRHVRCIQTLMSVARDDGELLGTSWEHVFRALSEINRFHQLFHLMARNDRAAAAAAERRRQRLQERERRRQLRQEAQDGDDSLSQDGADLESESYDSLDESDLFSDEEDDDFPLDEDMDAKAVDEANARVVYDAVSESVIEAIYERSSTLSAQAVSDFVTQLCIVSRMEISAGHSPSSEGVWDLTQVSYRQQHALLNEQELFHHSQPSIYNLQKLVEVTHYNMDSRPRLIFADLWQIVADFLTGTALHRNPAIAMYAVDSFRQLSIQYLQRDELEVFEFQKRFLKPLEVVMAKSEQTSTKELLLNCVDRIVDVFRGGNETKRRGGLKSGWVPILTILSLGGRDPHDMICQMSFKVLTGEIEPCLHNKDTSYVLLSEHFVETVDALLSFVGGHHLSVGLQALDQLQLLAKYLADDAIAAPHVRRKSVIGGHDSSGDPKEVLGLWWPILLGLSRATGDARHELRSKALTTLVELIQTYFCTSNDDDMIQVLQLIFRGILFPILEHAELSGPVPPSLPEDFERFCTKAPIRDTAAEEIVDDGDEEEGWMETMLDPFLDACISLCLRQQTDALVEDVFALLNHCLLSDSGHLAVRGLQRLEQFVTSDLEEKHLNDGVWATVSHMLRRCLAVRDLPTPPSKKKAAAAAAAPIPEDDVSTASDEASTKTSTTAGEEYDYNTAIQDFLAEERHFPERRYIGSNACMVIGQLLSSERYSQSLSLRWRLFLIQGLGRGIVDWEQAASILHEQDEQQQAVDSSVAVAPDYYETAMYGRKWMNRFLLQLSSVKEIATADASAAKANNRYVAGQKLVMDETQRLLLTFIKREERAGNASIDKRLYTRMTSLVQELLAGFTKMPLIKWMNPILLESTIQSKNETIRMNVQKLVNSKRTTNE